MVDWNKLLITACMGMQFSWESDAQTLRASRRRNWLFSNYGVKYTYNLLY